MNEKRVRMMAKLADFEERNRELLQNAEGYYRSDYIGIHLLKNLLRITAAYIIGLGLWSCYSMDFLMKKLNTMEIKEIAVRILIFYGVIAGLFLLLTYVLHTVRFYQSEKKLQTYRNMLERLILEYGGEEPGRMKGNTREKRRRQGGTEHDGTVEL